MFRAESTANFSASGTEDGSCGPGGWMRIGVVALCIFRRANSFSYGVSFTTACIRLVPPTLAPPHRFLGSASGDLFAAVDRDGVASDPAHAWS